MKKEFLDLGQQPIANNFLTPDQFDGEYFFNLKVGFDEDTCLVSLLDFVDKSMLFNENYVYQSSGSQTMRKHFSDAAKLIPKGSRVLEIGSNDGVFLKHFDTKQAIAIEPCSNFAAITGDLGYKTYAEFWDTDMAEVIVSEDGEQDYVFSANCFCHIPTLDEAFQAIHKVLKDGGIFIFEDPSLGKMIERTSYDQIYDEHAHIFSVTALKKALARNGLTLTKVEPLSVHGGSNRIYACKNPSGEIDRSVHEHLIEEDQAGLNKMETYEKFAKRIRASKISLVHILKENKNNGRGYKTISYGATSKSTTVFNYCGIGPDLIEYITDTTPDKQGKYSPGMHIPVVPYEGNFDETVDYAFLGAWNFIDEIKKKEHDFLMRGGRFITHVPIVRIIGG